MQQVQVGEFRNVNKSPRRLHQDTTRKVKRKSICAVPLLLEFDDHNFDQPQIDFL